MTGVTYLKARYASGHATTRWRSALGGRLSPRIAAQRRRCNVCIGCETFNLGFEIFAPAHYRGNLLGWSFPSTFPLRTTILGKVIDIGIRNSEPIAGIGNSDLTPEQAFNLLIQSIEKRKQVLKRLGKEMAYKIACSELEVVHHQLNKVRTHFIQQRNRETNLRRRPGPVTISLP